MVLAELSATVVQPPGARAAVASPYPGLVQAVLVQPGQAVRKGQLLATLASREASELALELARAQARGGVVAAEAARMDALAQAGVVAAARADAATAADAEARIGVRMTERLLTQTGAGRDGLIRLRSPMNGRVTSVSLDVGLAVDGLGALIIIEAQGSRWLDLQIPERLAGTARQGLVVETEDGQRGRLEMVSPALDPRTRAFVARARLDDAGPALVGGRLLRLRLLAPAPAGAVAVPARALVNENGTEMVFVKTQAGFAARPVRRLGSGDPAVIGSGLAAGEAVATSNLPELRATAGS